MSFQKLYDALTKERASRGKLGLNWSTTDQESDYSCQTEVGETQMTTETGDSNNPEIEFPETDNGSNYCSHNNFGRVRMASNPYQSSKHEVNFPKDDETSMKIVLEEGREAEREHQAQDPAIKLVFKLAIADKTARKRPLANLT